MANLKSILDAFSMNFKFLGERMPCANGQSFLNAQLCAIILVFITARDSRMLEFMEMLAVFEASRKSMLPAKYQAMPKDEFNQRFELLKASLNVS